MGAGKSESRSFSVSHNGIARELTSPCGVCAGTPADKGGVFSGRQFKAIWDTGATNSVITSRVVEICGLKASGMTMTHGVHGPQPSKTYLVNVLLPNNVQFANLRVTEGNLGTGGADLLLGMDIIAAGDFCVSHFGGKTCMSFRVPSQSLTDYVAMHHELPQRGDRGRQKKASHGGKTFGKKKR